MSYDIERDVGQNSGLTGLRRRSYRPQFFRDLPESSH